MMKETVEFLRERIPFTPKAAIILGTGLNSLAEAVTEPIVIPYGEIPGFAVSTAPSHAGKLIAGKISGMPVMVMQGRLHYYEGFKMEQVVYPVRVFAKLGIEHLFVTNAAGSLNKDFGPGQIVMLRDHINLMGTNPLIGSNDVSLGERFPSMHAPYDAALRRKAREIAAILGVSLAEGVYLAVTGPSLETKAECKMIQLLGADLVGMSTVPEVITAVHAGLKVLAFSVVTNYGNIFHDLPHSQEEIRENALLARDNLQEIIINILPKL